MLLADDKIKMEPLLSILIAADHFQIKQCKHSSDKAEKSIPFRQSNKHTSAFHLLSSIQQIFIEAGTL